MTGTVASLTASIAKATIMTKPTTTNFNDNHYTSKSNNNSSNTTTKSNNNNSLGNKVNTCNHCDWDKNYRDTKKSRLFPTLALKSSLFILRLATLLCPFILQSEFSLVKICGSFEPELGFSSVPANTCFA